MACSLAVRLDFELLMKPLGLRRSSASHRSASSASSAVSWSGSSSCSVFKELKYAFALLNFSAWRLLTQTQVATIANKMRRPMATIIARAKASPWLDESATPP